MESYAGLPGQHDFEEAGYNEGRVPHTHYVLKFNYCQWRCVR